jgi:hypothetical protein
MSTATIDETKSASNASTEAPAKPAKKEKRPYVFTPYQAMKVVNDMLDKAGLDIKLQGPMLYQYASQGKFKSHPAQVDIDRGEPEHKVRLEADEASFMEWAEAFVAGKLPKAETESDTESGTGDELDAEARAEQVDETDPDEDELEDGDEDELEEAE